MASEWKYKIFWLTRVTFCSIGLILQVNNVSQRFFEYRTRTLVTLVVPSTIIYPSISTCWRINDIIDIDAVKIRYPDIQLKRWNEEGFTWKSFHDMTKEFTISELFNFTPGIHDVLEQSSGCRIRYPKKYMLSRDNTDICHEMFKITKYIERQFICYRFVPLISNELLQMFEFTMSPGFNELVYKIYFNPKIFSPIQTVSVSTHFNDSSQLWDSVFSSNFFLSNFIRNDNSTLPTIFVTYREIERRRLKIPYDTNCMLLPFPYRSWFEMFLDMVDKEMISKFNISIPFVPSYEDIVMNATYRKLHSYSYFENKTLDQGLADAIRKPLPKRPGCRTKFFITQTELIKEDYFSLVVNWPKAEKITVEYVPEQELIDYAVYICSCVGIWFGLSAYTVLDKILGTGNHMLRNTESDDTELQIFRKKSNIQELKIISLNKKCNNMNRKIILLQNFLHHLYDVIEN